MCFPPRIPSRAEGRYGQSSRNVGRGAVDAGSATDERGLLRGREAVWFWRPFAGVKFARTRKRRADDGVNKASGPRGERGISRKPLRGECRMFSGASAVNTGVHTHYQSAHTRLRVHWAPGIPRALSLQSGG